MDIMFNEEVIQLFKKVKRDTQSLKAFIAEAAEKYAMILNVLNMDLTAAEKYKKILIIKEKRVKRNYKGMMENNDRWRKE